MITHSLHIFHHSSICTDQRVRGPSSLDKYLSNCQKEAGDAEKGQVAKGSGRVGDASERDHSSVLVQTACAYHAHAMHAYSLSNSF